MQDDRREPVEQPGDYEYDEAHDIPPGDAPSGAWHDGERPPTDVRIPEGDGGGDYSYDLAHDVPPAEGQPPH